MKDQPNLRDNQPKFELIVPLSLSLKNFLDEQSKLEGRTPADIVIAALLRTYNPHSVETPSKEK